MKFFSSSFFSLIILYYLFEEVQTYKQIIETVQRSLLSSVTDDKSVDPAFDLHFNPVSPSLAATTASDSTLPLVYMF